MPHPKQPTLIQLKPNQSAVPPLKEPELPKPGTQISKSDYKTRGLAMGALAAAVVREMEKEMDREL